MREKIIKEKKVKIQNNAAGSWLCSLGCLVGFGYFLGGEGVLET